jgi:hypothetical protein
LTGLAPQTQATTLTVTTPDTGASGTTATVTITQPGAGATAPVAITSITISGTATVTGDGATTTLPFTGTAGPVASGAVTPDVVATATLTLPPSSGTVTVTLPTNYNLSTVITGLGNEGGPCAATAPSTSASITVAAQPTVTVTSISGETSTTAARPGATVNFTGASFAAGATVNAALVPSGGGTAIPLGGPLTADPSGAITGSAAIPSTVTAGAYALTFSDNSGDLPATDPLTILGAPVCGDNPGSGGAGTTTTVTCSGFDPNATVVAQGYTAGQAATTDPAAPTTADASGNVSVKYTVNDTNTAAIVVAETSPGAPGTIFGYAPFAASANSCIAQQGGATSGSCSTSQGTTTTVNAGPLEMAQGGAQITLSNITLNGKPQNVNGNLNQVTVSDFRGSTLGWTLNATATDFKGSTGGTISAGSMTVTPACGDDPAGLAQAGLSSFPSTVAAGPAATMGSQVVLCSEQGTSTTPPSVTGGVFDVTGGLTVALPAYMLAGNYTDTITFSLG